MDDELIILLQTIVFVVIAISFVTIAIFEFLSYRIRCKSPLRAEVAADEAIFKIADLEKKLDRRLSFLESQLKDLKHGNSNSKAGNDLEEE